MSEDVALRQIRFSQPLNADDYTAIESVIAHAQAEAVEAVLTELKNDVQPAIHEGMSVIDTSNIWLGNIHRLRSRARQTLTKPSDD